MKTYYERQQVKTSSQVARGALVAVLVALLWPVSRRWLMTIPRRISPA